MTVSDQYGINVTNQSATIPEGVNARLACIDQQVQPIDEEQTAGEKPIRGRKP